MCPLFLELVIKFGYSQLTQIPFVLNRTHLYLVVPDPHYPPHDFLDHSALGGRVGLIDADVHGPSLPSLVSLEEDTLPLTQRGDNKLLVPPVVGGVRLMSYGFIAKGASQGKG